MYKINSYLKQANNEGDDSLIIFSFNNMTLLCLSDGAGGISGGREASQIVCNFFIQKIEFFIKNNSLTIFEDLLKELDNEIFYDKVAGEATCVVALIKNNEIIGASVGDSECWIIESDIEYELSMYQRTKPLLGSGCSEPIGFGPMDICGNIIIGSDGLFKYTTIKEIKKILSLDKFNIEDLSKLVIKHTGYLQDDISIITIRKEGIANDS